MAELAVEPVEQKSPQWSLRRLWERIVEPVAEVQGVERRKARLLSSMLFVLGVTGSLLTFQTTMNAILGALEQRNLISIFAVLVVWIAYVVSRTRHYIIAVFLTLGIANGAIFALVLTTQAAPNPITLNYLIISVLISSMLLSARGTLHLILLNAACILVLPVVAPAVGDVSPQFGFVTMTSLLLLVFLWHRDVLEQDRQAHLKQALKQTEEANEALQKANALAKETIRLKAEFMSTMSHELRTPLNAITGFCGIMLSGMGGEIDSEAQHMMERIQANSDRLLLLINQVLDLAKMDADRLDVVSVPVSPAELAEQWRSQVSVLAEKKGLAFDVGVDPALPTAIYGDPERLTQIAINLLSNAFKFTESGGVKLQLKKQQDTWAIEVSDTGIGIPPHALNYIFDEFRQLDGSSTRIYGGSGLGLAIVRKLCLLMDGNVRAVSQLGEGSTFTATLPLKPVAKAEFVVVE